MEEPTLQAILREKYNINDRLLAEGRFVGLIGDHATNLICLGLGIRCLAIARVVLSGDVIDYELLSLLPLKILSLSYQNVAKKIKIMSQFKATQVYQMCTSANQAEVWDNFTSTIREVYMPEHGDFWCSQTLQPPKFYHASRSVDFEQSYEGISHRSSASSMLSKSVSSCQRFCSQFSESSESLPAKLPSQAENTNILLNYSQKSQSMVNIGMQFESFVNDACSDSNGRSCNTLSCPFSDDKLNVSNNFIEAKDISSTQIVISEGKEKSQDGRWGRFFNRVFCCSKKSKR